MPRDGEERHATRKQKLVIRRKGKYMPSSLLSGLTDLFKSQLLGPLAAQSGESESSISRGFEVGSGSLITGLASKLGQPGLGKQIFDMISGPGNDPGLLNNAKSLLTGGSGAPANSLASNLLSTVFGSQQSAITDVIGRVAGLRGGTVASLLSMGAPLLLGMLGKRVKEGGLNAGGLTTFLTQEASSVRGMLPPELTSFFSGAKTTEPAFVPPVATVVTKEKSRGWLLPLLLALVVLLGLIWWFASRNKTAPTTATETATTAPAAAPPPAATAPAPAADYVTRTLPGNVDLKIPADRMEDHLLVFIQEPSKHVDKNTWFDFDRLLFDTGSVALQPSSQEQLQNIANILKAYPKVKVKIGGYTDNTGDAKTNKKLSEARATLVKQQLIAMNIAANRLDAEGYGEEHPVADNSTDEGRQKNRRISLRVTKK